MYIFSLQFSSEKGENLDLETFLKKEIIFEILFEILFEIIFIKNLVIVALECRNDLSRIKAVKAINLTFINETPLSLFTTIATTPKMGIKSKDTNNIFF
jgi:hypothetical protein